MVGELRNLSEQVARTREAAGEQMELARDLATRTGAEWAAMRARIESAQTTWLSAKAIEDSSCLASSVARPETPGVYTVVATDGSQIPLDRHAPAPFFVINVGLVGLHYGAGERPLLSSRARLYYRDADVLTAGADGEATYVGERQIASERALSETRALSELIVQAAGRPAVLGLIDGTLILWAQEGESPATRQEAVARLVELQNAAVQSGALLAGYISRPRSREAVNALKVCLYPPGVTRLSEYPAENLPGGGFSRLTDADLFGALLRPGERSIAFESQSRVLAEYERAAASLAGVDPKKYRIAFFYVKAPFGAGGEIARVEFPVWLADDAASLNRLHAIVVHQFETGRGYPIALQEAHELAVVRAPEREAFCRLVEKRCVQDGVAVVRSQKSVSKQVRFI